MAYRAEYDLSENNFALSHPEWPPPQGSPPRIPAPQVPALLSEFWRFRRYGLPPLAGGMRDQPVGWFEHGELLSSVYSAWTAWMQGDKGPEWRAAHVDILPLIRFVRETVYG